MSLLHVLQLLYNIAMIDCCSSVIVGWRSELTTPSRTGLSFCLTTCHLVLVRRRLKIIVKSCWNIISHLNKAETISITELVHSVLNKHRSAISRKSVCLLAKQRGMTWKCLNGIKHTLIKLMYDIQKRCVCYIPKRSCHFMLCFAMFNNSPSILFHCYRWLTRFQ